MIHSGSGANVRSYRKMWSVRHIIEGGANWGNVKLRFWLSPAWGLEKKRGDLRYQPNDDIETRVLSVGIQQITSKKSLAKSPYVKVFSHAECFSFYIYMFLCVKISNCVKCVKSVNPSINIM